jgi:hypothetical protein
MHLLQGAIANTLENRRKTNFSKPPQTDSGDGEAYYFRAFLRPLESSVSPRFFSWRPIAD